MPDKTRITAWLLFSILMVPALAFAEVRARLVGKVLDPDGKPLVGVVVTVTSPQVPAFKDTQTTDRKGVFEVEFTHVDVTYRYHFTRAGYVTMDAEQQWSLEGTAHYEWKMQESTAPAGVEQAPVSTSQEAVTAFNLALAAFKAKDLATAEAKFNEAVAADPNLRQAWEALAQVQVEAGHDQQAADAAEKAIALGSNAEAVYEARWQAYRNLKDDAKANEALKDLEKVGRRTEDAKKFHNEGVALTKSGDFAGAFGKFQEALNLDPTLQASQLGLATAGIKIGKYAEAAAAAQAVLKDDPSNEKAVRLNFNACLGLGDKTKLVDALILLAPYEPIPSRDGLVRLAFEAYDANDMVTAKERFNKALKVDPKYGPAYYYLGVIAVGRGDTAEAKSDLEQFLQLAPSDKEAEAAREMLKYLGKS
jgi:tetratricopeptide (TPR) repeat protein